MATPNTSNAKPIARIAPPTVGAHPRRWGRYGDHSRQRAAAQVRKPEARDRSRDLGRGVTVTGVALRHGVGRSMLFAWRKRLLGDASAPTAQHFVPVALTPPIPPPVSQTPMRQRSTSLLLAARGCAWLARSIRI